MEGFLQRKIYSKATKAFLSVSYWLKVFLFFFFLFYGGSLYSRWIDAHYLPSNSGNRNCPNPKPKKPAPILACPTQIDPTNITCPTSGSSSPPLHYFPPTQPALSTPTCPDYFRWIHEDLRPWAAVGITKETVESSKVHAAFRLIIIDGRAYVHHYHNVFQTRDTFTIWGIVQLLRRYPGRVPDLDLMFNCEDMPVVSATTSPGSPPPPPLFRYCKDDSTIDIVFPDWSFWGWPEVNIKSWTILMEEMREASERRRWSEREPYAYWKGNPEVSETRLDMMKCNLTKDMEWKARLFRVNWEEEERQGFPTSNLASQCATYRYKLYVEGNAWSVSEKYILGCDSPTLYVESRFEDFVSRGLRPGRHYWPISRERKCWAIKQAVDWGNEHTEEAEAIGKAGSRFIKEDLKMDYVYDYMLHLLAEYSKLLTYKPTKPEEAIELCSEAVACPFRGKARDYLEESMEADAGGGGGSEPPCSLPPPFSADELAELLAEKKVNGAGEAVERLMKKKKKSAGRRAVGFVGELWGFLSLVIFFICFA